MCGRLKQRPSRWRQALLQVLQAARAEVRLLSDFGQPLQAKQAKQVTNAQKLQMLVQCGWDDDRLQDDAFDAMHAVLNGGHSHSSGCRSPEDMELLPGLGIKCGGAREACRVPCRRLAPRLVCRPE